MFAARRGSARQQLLPPPGEGRRAASCARRSTGRSSRRARALPRCGDVDAYVADTAARAASRSCRSSSTPPGFYAEGGERTPGDPASAATRPGDDGALRRARSCAATARTAASGASTRPARACRSGPGRCGTSRTSRSTGAASPTPRPTCACCAASARAIHGADPKAEVVTGGLPDSRLGIPFEEYVRELYAAGAQGTVRHPRHPPLRRQRRRRAAAPSSARATPARRARRRRRPDLGHRARLGQRRARAARSRSARRRRRRASARSFAELLPSSARAAACAGSSTSTGRTPRRTPAARTSGACTPGCWTSRAARSRAELPTPSRLQNSGQRTGVLSDSMRMTELLDAPLSPRRPLGGAISCGCSARPRRRTARPSCAPLPDGARRHRARPRAPTPATFTGADRAPDRRRRASHGVEFIPEHAERRAGARRRVVTEADVEHGLPVRRRDVRRRHGEPDRRAPAPHRPLLQRDPPRAEARRAWRASRRTTCRAGTTSSR